MVTSDHFSAKIVVKGPKLKMGLQKKKKIILCCTFACKRRYYVRLVKKKKYLISSCLVAEIIMQKGCLFLNLKKCHDPNFSLCYT